MTAPDPLREDEVGAIVNQLTQAQRELVLQIGEGVSDASIVNSSDGDRLFDNGLRSEIRAAGMYFTNLTELGLAARAAILRLDQVREGRGK